MMMLDKIVERYKQRYGQELVGTDLGQFHVGFSMEGAKNEIYGVGNNFLGKKTYIYIYIYILESTNKGNNVINEEHIRMRGIPTPCISVMLKGKI